MSPKEYKRFEQYIISPFFSSNKRAVELFGLLKQHYPEFPADKIAKEALYKKLFPGEPYDDKKMRYAASDLFKLLEDYLTYLEFEDQTTRKKHLLLKSLDRRGLDTPFLRNVEQAKQSLEKRTYRDVNYFYNRILIEEDLYEFNDSRKSKRVDQNIGDLLESIDVHFLYRKLKYSCYILNLKNILSVEYDLSFLEAIVSYLRTNPPNTPALRIYLKSLLTLQDGDDTSHYYELTELLRTHIDDFSREEMRDMYGFAQNYCIKRINMGEDQFLEELLEIYKLLLAKGILLDNGVLSQFSFKNISTVALRLGTYDWVETFTRDYKSMLRPEVREMVTRYNYARIHFYRKEYRAALRQLLGVDARDVYYSLGTKSLLLKIYYEMDDIEPLLSLITSTRTWLKRNKSISDYQRTIYINLLDFLKQLVKVKLGGDKPIADISAEIDAVKKIADLTWLKSKVDELV